MRIASALVLLTILAALPTTSRAEDQVDCGASCPSGQTLVSFADGNSVTCSCVASATMDDTVSDPNVTEGPVNNAD